MTDDEEKFKKLQSEIESLKKEIAELKESHRQTKDSNFANQVSVWQKATAVGTLFNSLVLSFTALTGIMVYFKKVRKKSTEYFRKVTGVKKKKRK